MTDPDVQRFADYKLPKFIKVRFNPMVVSLGFSVVFPLGTVIYTKDPNVFLIPETSANQLRENGIRFSDDDRSL